MWLLHGSGDLIPEVFSSRGLANAVNETLRSQHNTTMKTTPAADAPVTKKLGATKVAAYAPTKPATPPDAPTEAT